MLLELLCLYLSDLENCLKYNLLHVPYNTVFLEKGDNIYNIEYSSKFKNLIL